MSDSFKRRRKDVKCWKCIDAFNRNCLFNTDKVAHKSKICFCPHTQEPWILVWSSATANRIYADMSNSFFLFIFTYWCSARSPLESASVSAADVLPWHISSPLVWMSSGHKPLGAVRKIMLGFKRDINSLIKVDNSYWTCSHLCISFLVKSFSSVCLIVKAMALRHFLHALIQHDWKPTKSRCGGT